MDVETDRMEAQLAVWGARIDDLAARSLRLGVAAGFDALLYVDEIKALHAIVRSKMDEYKTAEATKRKRLRTELTSVYNELAAAMKKRRPPPLARPG